MYELSRVGLRMRVFGSTMGVQPDGRTTTPRLLPPEPTRGTTPAIPPAGVVAVPDL